jgi:hypothetical protein
VIFEYCEKIKYEIANLLAIVQIWPFNLQFLVVEPQHRGPEKNYRQ